ncbi:hypothetical protein ACP4OV_022194 [Aristida adscensionis]
MIAFGDIARRIVGKPVQVVSREAKYNSVVPLDIASISAVPQLIAPAPPDQDPNLDAQPAEEAVATDVPTLAVVEAPPGSSSTTSPSNDVVDDLLDSTDMNTPPPEIATETPQKTSSGHVDTVDSGARKALFIVDTGASNSMNVSAEEV